MRNLKLQIKKPASLLKLNKLLIYQLIKREIAVRYRGSKLGMLWSFLTPILMLVIYTFVFSIVFKARWGTSNDNNIEFALILFSGISVFNLFSEIIIQSPRLIIGNVNYVKKVLFPLEILPLTLIGSALFHYVIQLLILLLGILFTYSTIHWTIIFLPLVLLPLLLVALGLSWFLASLGVFIRDIGHIITLFMQGLMFLSPIFYPVSSVPEKFRALLFLNPMSYVVEDIRKILIWGQMPDWGFMGTSLLLSTVTVVLGYIWFVKTKGGFADVL
ncbi:ABC transporter permease [Paenibacillus chitinolyticus]|uniref:Transport permease protein n=1 Tax=Paenibacillus chitinolyticus TaxID=79263 RepID=A0A410X4V1_9BACL|nr:ABC transporter permease [Paenibacillus chitinolyticus]